VTEPPGHSIVDTPEANTPDEDRSDDLGPARQPRRTTPWPTTPWPTMTPAGPTPHRPGRCTT